MVMVVVVVVVAAVVETGEIRVAVLVLVFL